MGWGEPTPEMRDRGATRALVLGLLALWFGIFAPFAVFSGARSLRRIRTSNRELHGAASATAGLVAGLIALTVIAVGVAYWVLRG
jgi:multisubunit Na+/H+ antiporter MnhB subunit